MHTHPYPSCSMQESLNSKGRIVAFCITIALGIGGPLFASGPAYADSPEDGEGVATIRQALNDAGCPPAGENETVVCERIFNEQIWEFFMRSWGMPRGSTGGEPVYKPNANKAIDEFDRRELAASQLVNPPATFGQKSKQLAQELANYLDRQVLGDFTVLIDVFQTLATTPTPEAMSRFDPVEVSSQLRRLGLGTRHWIRHRIGLGIATEVSTSDAEWWSAVDAGLKR